jgi:7,8-dihydroneopterin aldolase/epimerase/oxygenase
MDCIHITDLRVYGYTGALPEEQVLGQWFWLDITLYLDLAPSGASDILDDTLDYCNVIELVQDIVKRQRFVLLERSVAVIADAVLTQYHQVAQVRIKMTKPHPPIPDFGGKIAIEIIRDRQLP